MPSEVITTQTTRDDIKLIMTALAAYTHNTQYREVYERLRHQVGGFTGYSEEPRRVARQA